MDKNSLIIENYDIFDTKNIQFFNVIIYVFSCPLQCNAKSPLTCIFKCTSSYLTRQRGFFFPVDKKCPFDFEAFVNQIISDVLN